jgi:hypothetical protein
VVPEERVRHVEDALVDQLWEDPAAEIHPN